MSLQNMLQSLQTEYTLAFLAIGFIVLGSLQTDAKSSPQAWHKVIRTISWLAAGLVLGPGLIQGVSEVLQSVTGMLFMVACLIFAYLTALAYFSYAKVSLGIKRKSVEVAEQDSLLKRLLDDDVVRGTVEGVCTTKALDIIALALASDSIDEKKKAHFEKVLKREKINVNELNQ